VSSITGQIYSIVVRIGSLRGPGAPVAATESPSSRCLCLRPALAGIFYSNQALKERPGVRNTAVDQEGAQKTMAFLSTKIGFFRAVGEIHSGRFSRTATLLKSQFSTSNLKVQPAATISAFAGLPTAGLSLPHHAYYSPVYSALKVFHAYE